MKKRTVLFAREETALRTALPYFVLACAVLAGLGRAVGQWLKGKPEWSYYRQFVRQPLAEATGPDKPIFGYLPGSKALLAPFVWAEPLGYILFALLNALACVGIFFLIYRHFAAAGRSPLPRGLSLLWLSICSAVPIWFALQNNQLIAPAVFLTLLAFSLLAQRRDILAGVVFAFAVMLKTLPLPALLFPLICRRWGTVLTAGVSLAVLSVGLASLTEGVGGGIQSHVDWPSQVIAQSPLNALTKGAEPHSFYSNQSPAAEVVRLARATGIKQLVWVHVAVVFASLLALAVCSMRPASERLYWYKVGGWLAWIAYAAPFGRYYYLLFLVPALYVLGLRAFARYGGKCPICWTLLTLLSMLLMVARSHNPLYATASLLILILFLTVLIRDLISPQPGT